jgi:2-haloalkanoic acid dehalogenase type II
MLLRDEDWDALSAVREDALLIPCYDAVLFDLLTALLDSWSLWSAVAGSEAEGRRWRTTYLRIGYAAGAYRPYEDLVAEAAEMADLPGSLAIDLEARYAELRPWPGVPSALRAIASAGIRMGVVTNCSERLGRIAAGCVGVEFDAIVTAERAGSYKPEPRPYLLAMEELKVEPRRALFVAGSPFDLSGAAEVGLQTYWHDKSGMPMPDGAPPPIAHETSLEKLVDLVCAET